MFSISHVLMFTFTFNKMKMFPYNLQKLILISYFFNLYKK